MLHYAWVFLVLAIIAAIFGFGGVAAAAAGIAKVLFFIFIALFVIGLLTGRGDILHTRRHGGGGFPRAGAPGGGGGGTPLPRAKRALERARARVLEDRYTDAAAALRDASKSLADYERDSPG